MMGSLLALTFWIYSHGFGANFKLDDFHNLALLSQVSDLDSLLLYIFNGAAGPSGRPLALMSYLINVSSWPDDPQPFLYTNTLIHLLNGLLLAWLTYRLALTRHDMSTAVNAALVASALWLLHPMFVSTTLYVIQRMASLSTTFVLAGLVGYAISRQCCKSNPRIGALGMAASVGGGTLLAILCKENGVVLPALAWLIDSVFFRHQDPSLSMKRWRQSLTVVPTLLVIAYVAYQLPHLPATYATRDFTLGERLLTEPRVVLDYLKLIVMPVRSQLGIFHDEYEISRTLLSPPATLPAVLAIVGLAGTAIWQRQRFPLFFFAISWFFIGHALESSVFPLEPYFEHRNYMATLGLAIAAGISIARVSVHLRTLAAGLLAVYLGLYAFVLNETTSQWGEPAVAADLWYRENPNSDRALQYYAQMLSIHDKWDTLEDLFVHAIALKPEHPTHRLQHLITHCFRDDPLPPQEWQSMRNVLMHAKLNFAAAPTLEKIANLAIDDVCPSVLNREQVKSLVYALLGNPRYLMNGVVAHQLHVVLATIYDTEGNFERTLSNLMEAKRYRPYPGTSLMIASVLATHQRPQQAVDELDQAIQKLSMHHPAERYWIRQLRELRDALLATKPTE